MSERRLKKYNVQLIRTTLMSVFDIADVRIVMQDDDLIVMVSEIHGDVEHGRLVSTNEHRNTAAIMSDLIMQFAPLLPYKFASTSPMTSWHILEINALMVDAKFHYITFSVVDDGAIKVTASHRGAPLNSARHSFVVTDLNIDRLRFISQVKSQIKNIKVNV